MAILLSFCQSKLTLLNHFYQFWVINRLQGFNLLFHSLTHLLLNVLENEITGEASSWLGPGPMHGS